MTKNRLLLLMVVFLFSLAYLPQQTQAQAVYGSISGTVTDSTGAVVPGATVTITSVERRTSDTVTTNDSGTYSKERLLPGSYQIKVEKQAVSLKSATALDLKKLKRY